MPRKRSAVGPRAGESQRQLRVAEEMRHALALILRHGGLRDPALRDANITVAEVRISPDLRNATAFVMPLGGAHVPEIMAGLQRSAAFIKNLVAREVAFRHMPKLVFELDNSFEQAGRIAALLASPEVERDLHPPGGAAPDEGAD